jgi:hypothetical protein
VCSRRSTTAFIGGLGEVGSHNVKCTSTSRHGKRHGGVRGAEYGGDASGWTARRACTRGTRGVGGKHQW